jgi:dibenzofuran dioxygenase subunit beta
MNAPELRHQFEELLYREAWLLDHDQLEDWLALFTDDVRYRAPVRRNLERGREDWHEPQMLALFDDDRRGLEMRVQRIRTGLAHAEEPPSRVRHFVSNVLVLGFDSKEAEADVCSNFIVFRSRGLHEETMFVGSRQDRWCRIGDLWKIRERLIIFDHAVTDNLTLLF